MPRSAARSEAQTLQGSLFGALEPAEATTNHSIQTADPELEDLSDASLSADAAARPRRRQERSETTSQCTDPSAAGSGADDDSSDEPAWAHHSQMDSVQAYRNGRGNRSRAQSRILGQPGGAVIVDADLSP